MAAQIPKRKRFENDKTTVIKVTSADLTLLSKVLAVLHSRFKILSSSSIMINRETCCYFAYINILNREVAEALQEITPFGAPKP